MIISKDVNVERDYYYLGAKIIEIIATTDEDRVCFFDVFSRLKEVENVSMNLFSLTVDWLYILGVVKGIEKGQIIKCF